MDRGGVSHAVQALLCLIYSFHMPLFVFISGFFSKNLQKRRDTAFARLLIPFVLSQLVLGVTTFFTEGNLWLIKNPVYAQYGTWYLIALFIWRITLPDFSKIKHLLLISVVLFFATPLFYGMDNTMALQRTLGFYVFFLLGYYADQISIEKLIKIPIPLCVVILFAELCVLFLAFDKFEIPYGPVFSIFAHSLTISKNLAQIPLVIGAYIVGFVLAVFNSVLFLNIFFRKNRLFDRIGEDTMPLYLTHLPLVNIFAALLAGMPDITYLILSILVIVIFVYGFSSVWYRAKFNLFFHSIENFICVKDADVT